MSARYVLGLNQYTHSASACLLDEYGQIVYALAKERVTRKKHDGGDNAEVIEAVLKGVGIQRDQISLCVANNHLFRIPPFEKTLPWAVSLNQHPPSYVSPQNLLPGVAKHELSHHLAHAWSVMPLAPFESGLIVVADGIGSTYADVHRLSTSSDLGAYSSDADLAHANGYVQLPANLQQQISEKNATFREAESVFQFDGLQLKSLFKRWIKEHSPVFLYNYGFENQESLGAVYSRVSSHIFGDWNACGKVMGMAPWAGRWQPDPGARRVLTGPLEELQVDWQRLQMEPGANGWEEKENRAAYARLSADLQHDLEEVVLDYLRRLQQQTGERNLCLVGGVALNSTLNGRIAREAGFEQVFIPPWPGDDGVAIGCAQFGHYLQNTSAKPARAAIQPYLGGAANRADIEMALEEVANWIDLEPESENRVERAADALAAGLVVGWFQGRSEFGPRALGNRSILATPADPDMVQRINAAIKKRESFRPFAPTVLAAYADEFFADVNASPFMSLTVHTHPHQQQRIPAVVHVDGTARIQTLQREDNPLYYQLIEAFYHRTGLPMLLNTSFNIKGEPIVESAADALRHFLDSELDLLILEGNVVHKRAFPDFDELQELRPVAFSGFTAEVVSNAEGETMRLSLMAHGQNWEAEQLELGVLEACTGEMTTADLITEFQAEFDVDPSDVVACLQQSYQRRLLHFEA